MARRNSRFSRSNAFSRARSSLLKPGRWSASTSAWRTQWPSDPADGVVAFALLVGHLGDQPDGPLTELGWIPPLERMVLLLSCAMTPSSSKRWSLHRCQGGSVGCIIALVAGAVLVLGIVGDERWTRTDSSLVTSSPTASLREVAGQRPGTIEFGTAYDPLTLMIDSPRTTFALGQEVFLSAVFSRAPESTIVGLVVSKLPSDEGGTTVIRIDERLSTPSVTRVVRTLDLATMLHREIGSFVMRYIAGTNVLAEGRFTLTAPAVLPATCPPGEQDPFVYSPDRLQVLSACQRITGIVRAIDAPTDGDRHIYVELDAAYRHLLMAGFGTQTGRLVVEPICIGPFAEPDIERLCAQGPPSLKSLPGIGDHVWMEGRYVLDTPHALWAELHPLYRWGRLHR